MLANRTDRALVALLVLVVCTIAYATSAITATAAQAYTLGAADGNPAAAPIAAHVGARTYRIVMDPNAPLDAYADRIEAFRAHGMRPQIVVGGTGTTVRGRTTVEKWQIVNTAIHAFERWPDTYSVSVINEPDLAGVSACQYAKTYRTAYRMLKRAGVPRVLFGEFSPLNPLRWTKRALDCVGSLKTDGWAWHGYDSLPSYTGMARVAEVRRFVDATSLRTGRGNHPELYCTEYGVKTRGDAANTEAEGRAMWARALSNARRYKVAEVVIWQILPVDGDSESWDTSIVAADGHPRPAFATIASAD